VETFYQAVLSFIDSNFHTKDNHYKKTTK